MDSKAKPVRITNSIPALAADGHGIGINPENGVTNLVFIQVNLSQDPKAAEAPEAEGSMISNVRLSFEQLKKLNSDISKAIESYKPKEKNE